MVDSLDVPVEEALRTLPLPREDLGDYWLLQDAIRHGYLPEGAKEDALTRDVRERMVMEGLFVLYEDDGSVAFSFPEAKMFAQYSAVTYRSALE